MAARTLPPEVIDLILEAFVKLNVLQDVVKLRVINRDFKSRIDTLVLLQERFFDVREKPGDHTYHSKAANQHFYNNIGRISWQIAGRLIELNWSDDSFVHPDFRNLFQRLEEVVIEADASHEASQIRTRLCELLARTSKIYVDTRSCQEAFFDYTSLVVKDAQELEAKEVSEECHTDARRLQWLRQEAYSLATGICEPQVVQSLAYDDSLLTPGDTVYILGSEMASSLSRYWGIPIRGSVKTSIRGSPIEIGAICGRVDNLRLLLEELEQESKTQDHEQSLQNGLELASEFGHMEVVKLLLDIIVRHKMLRGHSESETRAFEKACLYSHLDIAELLEPHFSPNIGHSNEPYIDLILYTCVAQGSQPSTIRYLVAKGASPNNLYSPPGNPLRWAIQFGHLDLVNTLVDLGSDVQVEDLWVACFWAVYWDDCKMLKCVADAGVQIYQKMSNSDPRTFELALLPLASRRRSFGAVEFLLKRYPQLLEDGQLLKAIENTAEHTDTSMARLLLECNTDVAGENGGCAVFKATVAGNKPLLTLLLENGADPNMAFPHDLKQRSTASPTTNTIRSQDMSPLAVAECELKREESTQEVRQNFAAIVEMLKCSGAKSSYGATYVSGISHRVLSQTSSSATSQTESNTGQDSTALELYFRQWE